MGDSTVWTLAIAALTGGTAVLASWVTGRGSAQAARIQAETGARAQRAERLRESRRAAYLDLIEQAHTMGELYWEISGALQLPATAPRTEALAGLHDREIAEYAKIRRCARVVELEGPPRPPPRRSPCKRRPARSSRRSRPNGPARRTAGRTSTTPTTRSGRPWRTSWTRPATPTRATVTESRRRPGHGEIARLKVPSGSRCCRAQDVAPPDCRVTGGRCAHIGVQVPVSRGPRGVEPRWSRSAVSAGCGLSARQIRECG